MKEKNSRFFILLSFILLIVVVVWSGIRLYTLKSENGATAKKNFNILRETVTSSYLAHSSFDSLHFRSAMESYFKKHDRFRAVVIFSKPGVDYLYAVHPAYLSVFPGSSSFSALKSDNNTIHALNRFFESDFTAPLQIPKHEDMVISSVYNIVTRGELYQVLRDSGIAFFILILIFAVFLIITSKKKTVQARSENIRHSRSSGVEQSVSPGEIEEIPAARFEAETSAFSPVDEETTVKTQTEQSQNSSKGLFSPHSGLGWEGYLENRLNFELRRAASVDQ